MTDKNAAVSPMEQLIGFVDWERKNNPGQTHVAEWALAEIERQHEALLAFEQAFQEARRLEKHCWPNTFGKAYKEQRALFDALLPIRVKMRTALGLDPNVL